MFVGAFATLGKYPSMIDLRRSGRTINDGDSFSVQVQIVGSRAHAEKGGKEAAERAQSVFPRETSTHSYLHLSTSDSDTKLSDGIGAMPSKHN